MLCRICTVQIKPRKHALGHEGSAASTRKHELGNTDRTDHTEHSDYRHQGYKYLGHEVGSEVGKPA